MEETSVGMLDDENIGGDNRRSTMLRTERTRGLPDPIKKKNSADLVIMPRDVTQLMNYVTKFCINERLTD